MPFTNMDCPHLVEYTSFPSEVIQLKDTKLQCCGKYYNILSLLRFIILDHFSWNINLFLVATFQSIKLLHSRLLFPGVIKIECKYFEFVVECSTSHSLWMCLTCGKVNCGRYVNGHALKHYEVNNDHKVTLSTESASLYWYSPFVIDGDF